MMVMMSTEFPCHCGKPVNALRFADVRVNLNSLRGVSDGLVMVSSRDHDGCKSITVPADTAWKLDEESSAKVAAARDKIRARRKVKA